MTGVTVVRDIPVDLEESDVLSALGARDRPAPGLSTEVDEMLSLGLTLARPAAVWVRLEVAKMDAKAVEFDDGTILDGRFMAHCFEGATEAMFLVATAGEAIEAKVAELFAEGMSIEAFVLDAVGSATAKDAFSHTIQQIYNETTDRGWHTGLCLRPGQTYWDISGQQVLFGVVPSEKIGVSLLPSYAMLPKKSQSAVLPLGPDLKIHGDPDKSYCRYCAAKRCPMRREEPTTEELGGPAKPTSRAGDERATSREERKN